MGLYKLLRVQWCNKGELGYLVARLVVNQEVRSVHASTEQDFDVKRVHSVLRLTERNHDLA